MMVDLGALGINPDEVIKNYLTAEVNFVFEGEDSRTFTCSVKDKKFTVAELDEHTVLVSSDTNLMGITAVPNIKAAIITCVRDMSARESLNETIEEKMRLGLVTPMAGGRNIPPIWGGGK